MPNSITPPHQPPHQPTHDHALLQSNLSLPGLRRGKVRDVYALNSPASDPTNPTLLIVASDRLSAFDVVLPTPIPGKGRLLTEVSAFWFAMIKARGICDHHLLSTDPAALPDAAFAPADPNLPPTTRADLNGRIMIARAARVVPIECVCRGYLEGSGWREYQDRGTVCGVPLPPGLRQCDRLPQPIFTPATKEEQGRHDQNITFDHACQLVGGELMERLRHLSLAIYLAASEHALDRGIIIADTKFEFGIPLNAHPDAAADPTAIPTPILVDEALTPDSSRFWPAHSYQPGRAQPSYDKQFVREYLESLVARGEWAKQPPGPPLPPDVVTLTRNKYREARDRLLA
jgi:phosphoribosylaminoimidazole-succinocarboxamide synthase